MKREKLVTFLTGFVLAFLLSFGGVGAMISGLDLPVEHVNILYIVWFISAVLGCTLFSFKKGWIPALVIAALGVGFLSKYPAPACALITRLSAIYDSAYNWGVWEFVGVNWRGIPLDLPLAAWGCFIALAAAAAVVWGRGLILTVILTALPVCSTVVVTNTPPDAPYVFAVMLAMILLLLTSSVRRHSPHQGAKLSVLTALPVTLLLGLLFMAYPQDTYVNRSREYLNEVVGWWQSHIASAWDASGLLGQSAGAANVTPTTNLSLIGPRANWRYAVMDVTCQEGGVLYLRGQDYDVYDGASWTASPDREAYWNASWDTGNTVTISTRRNMNVLYLPYYTEDIYTTKGGRVDNENDLTEYSFGLAAIPGYLSAQMHAPSDEFVTTRADGVSDAYLSLPEDTLTWATEYLDEHISEVWSTSWTAISHDEYFMESLSNTEVADMIADHVRASARYDKGTRRMSGDYDDFAQWFLEESETGYCVHFATAAAVLLRAAGVPARYVTGYMADCEAGVQTTVRADQAHAWVEYYEPMVDNWVILESTPPDLEEAETAPTEETEPPTEETEPPTEETTAPPTEDREQTRPSDTPRPSNQEDPKIDLTPLWTALKWLLIPLGLWLLVIGQYVLRRSLRRHRGSPNARALAKWRDVELLCRVTRQEPPTDLESLAQKAKFSQHTLTSEELWTLDAWLKTERSKLKQKPWYVRFICRYILALC